MADPVAVTPPSDPDMLHQVTPASQWSQNNPRRIFVNETLFGSPAPVIESTHCELEQSSTSLLNLDDMSVSIFDEPLPKKVVAKPMTSTATRTAAVTTAATTNPSTCDIFASSCRATIRLAAKENPSSEAIRSSRIPRLTSRTAADSAASVERSMTHPGSLTYVLPSTPEQPHPRQAMGDAAATAAAATLTDHSLAAYLCPVEMSAISDVMSETLTAVDKTCTEQEPLTGPSTGEAVPAGLGAHSLASTDITSCVLTVRQNSSATNLRKPGVQTVPQTAQSAGSESASFSDSPILGSTKSLSQNLMEFSSSPSKLSHTASPSIFSDSWKPFSSAFNRSSGGEKTNASIVANAGISVTATNTGNNIATMTPGNNIAAALPECRSEKDGDSLTASLCLDNLTDIKSAPASSSQIHPVDDAMADGGLSNQSRPVDVATADSGLSNQSRLLSAHPSSINDTETSCAEKSVHEQLVLGDEPHCCNISLPAAPTEGVTAGAASKLLPGAASKPSLDMTCKPSTSTANEPSLGVPSKPSLVAASKPSLGVASKPSTSVTCKQSTIVACELPRGVACKTSFGVISNSPPPPTMICPTLSSEEKAVTDGSTDFSTSSSACMDVLRVDRIMGSANAADEPTGTNRERPRSISPIFLDLARDDELDTHSESGFSTISEMSESLKPIYTDSYLKVLMTGDGATILQTLSQHGMSSRPNSGSSQSAATSSYPCKVGTSQEPTTAPELNTRQTLTSASQYSNRYVTADSFFDVREGSKPALSSTLPPHSPIKGEGGLSFGSNELFNDPTGLSVSSLTTSPQNSSPPSLSLCTREIRNAVTSHLFRSDSTATDRPRAEEGADASLIRLSSHNTGSTSQLLRERIDTMPDLSRSDSTPPPLPAAEGGPGVLDRYALLVEKDVGSARRLNTSNNASVKSPHSTNQTAEHLEVINLSQTPQALHKGLPASPTHRLSPEVLLVEEESLDKTLVQENSGSLQEAAAETSATVASNITNLTANLQCSSLQDVTPGHPVYESSHIQHSSTSDRSDRSTHYLMLLAPQRINGAEPQERLSAGRSVGEGASTSRPLSATEISSIPKNVEDWLATHRANEYITDNNTTTVTFTTPNSDSATEFKYLPLESTSLLQNSTAFHTLPLAEDSTAVSGIDFTLHETEFSTSPEAATQPIAVAKTLVVPGVLCTLTSTCLSIPVTNLCNRWLQLSMGVTEHRINGRLSSTTLIFFRQGDSLLKPLTIDEIPVWVNTAIPGRHEVTISISVKGDDSEPVKIIVGLEVEALNIQLVDNSDGILDFGPVPYGCVKIIPLTLANRSNVTASLVLKVIQDPDDRSMMEVNADALTSQSTLTQPTRDPACLKLSLAGYQVLGGAHTQTLFVAIRTPERHGTRGSPETIRGRIEVYQATAITQEPLISISTQCVCGYGSVQVPAKYHSWELRCKPQSNITEGVSIRNAGDIPIDVTLSLSNAEFFSLSPTFLHLKAGEQSTYGLTFNTRSQRLVDIQNHVTCLVTATIEPEGKRSVIEVRGVIEAPSSIPAHIARLANNVLRPSAMDSGGYGSRSLKLKCTPCVIKFGGVELTEQKSIPVKILNHYDHPVRIMCDIDKAEFQLVSSIEGKDILSSCKEIILPVSRSDIDFSIVRVVFQPRQKGLVRSRLKGQCPGMDIRFRIYGYGGPSLIEPVIETRLSPRVYSISAGDIHSRQFYLHEFFVRNVGYHKGFMIAECFSGPTCAERLEHSRIHVLPSSAVICPADARRLSIRVNITEREKVLCEQTRDVIATIRITYVDQVLRQLLQRLVAVTPTLLDSEIAPFLPASSDDTEDMDIRMPDEACSLNTFKQGLRSFCINVYGEPMRRPVRSSTNTFPTTVPANIRPDQDPLTSTLTDFSGTRSKNRGTIRIQFTAQCAGHWEDVLSITTPERTFQLQLIGKCTPEG